MLCYATVATVKFLPFAVQNIGTHKKPAAFLKNQNIIGNFAKSKT